ncbi:guanine deaminase [Cercophora scortea]|uniref:Guanine deaminase n=1 Tax=Cercophora scortea TaxID=314031 RepID=A0AAE0IEY6_9PEZI|nr:guanine deaminase [Cercophora scortea]
MARASQFLALFAGIFTLGRAHPGHVRSLEAKQVPIGEPTLAINGIPPTTRSYWMRQATIALDAPCPFAAFGAVIVNHTANAGLGELVCSGANSNSKTGNPIMHGEMAAITNCSIILTDPNGPYKLTPAQALAALGDLSLYTNAESCPMCASAIRWAGFKEYIYGTSIDTLIEKGWGQIRISSLDVVAQSFDLSKPTRLLGEILTNETDPYFSWQFDPSYSCPKGCKRVSGTCKAA